MRGWPWLMLAACSGQGSIELVVTAPGLDVTRVELFVGVEDKTLEQIRPQQGPLADAVWWRRDRSHATDVRTLEREGQVVYQLVNGGSFQDSMAAFVVVGYDDNDKPIAVRSQLIWTDISNDQIDRYQFELRAAQKPPGTMDVPGVQVWGPPARPATSSTEAVEADPHACVQVANVKELAEYGHPVTGTVPASGLIVTKEDPDCDGLIDKAAPDFECATNEYMSTQIKRDSLKCGLKKTFVANGAGVPGCVVGGGTCVDGMRPDASSTPCTPSAYCMPTAACGCTQLPCDPYAPPPTAPYIVCAVHAPQSGGGTTTEFCPAPAVIDLGSLMPWLMVTCGTTRPAMLRKGHDSPWQSANYRIENDVSFASTAFADVFPGMDDCVFDVVPRGPVPRTPNGPIGEFGATLSIPFGPAAEGRGLMIPIYFSILPPTNDDCTQQRPTDCVVLEGSPTAPYDDDPGLRSCATAPVAPGSQVLD